MGYDVVVMADCASNFGVFAMERRRREAGVATGQLHERYVHREEVYLWWSNGCRKEGSMKLKKMQFAEIQLKQDQEWNKEVISHIKDMVRYDGAFINRDVPGIIAFPTWKTKEGDLYGKQTTGRWNSFGVKISPLTMSLPTMLQQDPFLVPDAWITYRTDNASDHVEFTLSEYARAKDSEKLRKETRIRVGKEKCGRCGSPERKHMGFCNEQI